MGGTVVLVLDRDDTRRGEMTMLSGAHEAARLAEELIEAGVEIERIRVFDATELPLRVAYKPAVSLRVDEDFQAPASEAAEKLEPEPAN